jgi:hypothetical protein
MLMFETWGLDGSHPMRVDLHAVALPSGVLAKNLPGPDLFRELTALGVPVEKSWGWQQLAIALARWNVAREVNK